MRFRCTFGGGTHTTLEFFVGGFLKVNPKARGANTPVLHQRVGLPEAKPAKEQYGQSVNTEHQAHGYARQRWVQCERPSEQLFSPDPAGPLGGAAGPGPLDKQLATIK